MGERGEDTGERSRQTYKQTGGKNEGRIERVSVQAVVAEGRQIKKKELLGLWIDRRLVRGSFRKLSELKSKEVPVWV